MSTKYKCVCCLTNENEVAVIPIKKEGNLICPYCGSIELEEMY